MDQANACSVVNPTYNKKVFESFPKCQPPWAKGNASLDLIEVKMNANIIDPQADIYRNQEIDCQVLIDNGPSQKWWEDK